MLRNLVKQAARVAAIGSYRAAPRMGSFTRPARRVSSSVFGARQPRSLAQGGPLRLWTRSLFIQTDSTPNPNSLKFIPGKPVLPEEYGNSKDFKNFESTNVSPLAKRLFKVDGVVNVYLTNDYVAVTRGDEERDWEDLKLDIYSAIMDFYASGQPAVTDEPQVSDTTIFDDDSEVVAMIKELLETRIRPAVQDDGGDILYSGFDEETGIVKLTLAGSCSGCPSSEVTLKNGVENMLMHYIPEVRGIEQVLDENDA